MARQVDIEIELQGGRKLSHFLKVEIQQDIYGPHCFEVIVPFEILEDHDESFFNRSFKEVIGKQISFSVTTKDKQGTKGLNFKGIVTSVGLRSDNSFTKYFSIKGQSMDILLRDGKQRRTFVGQTLRQIVEKVMEVYPQNMVKRKVQIDNDPEIAYMAQYEESNYEFMKRLANEYGQWFYYNGSQLIFGKYEEESTDFEINGAQNFDMSVSIKPIKFEAGRYNYIKDEEFTGASKNQSAGGMNQLLSFALDESENVFSQTNHIIPPASFNNVSELDEYVKVYRSVSTSNLILFNGEGENTDLTIGKIAEVKGIKYSQNGSSKESFGKYRILTITHTIDSNSNYENKFTAIPDALEIPPADPEISLPKGQIEVAEVIDNEDPEKLGRVKVKFYWGGDSMESDWIRISTLYSSDETGILFIPEKGAQVIVGYEFNNPSQPIVLGSFYHKQQGTSYTSDNNKSKIIQTKGGNQILFDDSDSECTISVTNKNKASTFINLSFKDDGSIDIKTDGSLSLEGKEVSIKADTFRIKADTSIQIEAGQKVELKSSEIKIKADTNGELSSSGAMKVTGANVDVEGQAIVNVKGSLIKLN